LNALFPYSIQACFLIKGLLFAAPLREKFSFDLKNISHAAAQRHSEKAAL